MKAVRNILFGLCVIGAIFWYYYKDEFTIKNVIESIGDNTSLVNRETTFQVSNCLSEPFKSDIVDELFDEIKNTYKNHGIAVSFKDLNNNYELNFNEKKIYYSASASKVFDVIYLFENNIDLTESLVYRPDIDMKGSVGMKKHKYYDKVTLLELITHLLRYSDNTAHYMLIEYIGVNNLRNYFKEYNLNINEADPFVSNYTATLARASIERLYNLLNSDNEDYKTIKDSMINNNMNSLNFDNVLINHKYGWYESTYHDVGFYDSDNPYVIAVLTTSGNGDYNYIVNDISKKIYNIYSKNLELKKEFCNNKI